MSEGNASAPPSEDALSTPLADRANTNELERDLPLPDAVTYQVPGTTYNHRHTKQVPDPQPNDEKCNPNINGCAAAPRSRPPPTSRPKIRCRHGPRKMGGDTNELPQTTSAETQMNRQPDHALSSPRVGTLRNQDTPGGVHAPEDTSNELNSETHMQEARPYLKHKRKSKSRLKIKCRFGPSRASTRHRSNASTSDTAAADRDPPQPVQEDRPPEVNDTHELPEPDHRTGPPH